VFVGIGEAGCSPSAYSLISDYFPPERRSTQRSEQNATKIQLDPHFRPLST
jgi:MFS family permease